MPDGFYIDSAQVGAFRALLDSRPEIKKVVGEIFQIEIVLDANVAIGDLLYKHKNPHLRATDLEECMRSSVMRVHAPLWLDFEMVISAIPKVAKKKRIPEQALQKLWSTYKLQLEWSDKYAAPSKPISDQLDHKDMPYVDLQYAIGAAGILSNDKGIDRLGGTRLSREFVKATRKYARATACSMTISVSGTVIANFSVQASAQLAKQVCGAVRRLPDGVKLLLIAAIVAALLHPISRRVILENMTKFSAVWSEVWPVLAELMNQASKNRKEAENALADIHEHLGRSVTQRRPCYDASPKGSGSFPPLVGFRGGFWGQ